MKKSKIFPIISYIYLCLPVLIFFAGWCNTLTAVIGGAAIAAGLISVCRNAPELRLPSNRRQRLLLFAAFAVSVIWVYLSGIGGFVFQNHDHQCRNPIFEMLVNEPWPVMHNSSPAVLTYYIAFWLPAAAAAKIAGGLQAGWYFQFIWAVLGIFLLFYYIPAFYKKKSFIPVIIFIFFSGLDALGLFFTGRSNALADASSHIEWWSFSFQFSSMTTQLFWVFNQAIAVWLIVPMLFLEKNNKSILFLYSCLFLHASLPAIGLFPVIVYLCLKNGRQCICFSELKNNITSLFTFQNTAAAAVISIVCASYLLNNVSGKNISLYEFHGSAEIIIYLLFLLLEAGVYFFAVFSLYKKNPLYYIIFFCLILYPLIEIGSGGDFCMRASIPALEILCLMVCRALESAYYRKKHHNAFVFLLICLIIGAAAPFHEIYRAVYMTNRGIIKEQSSLGFNNFFGLIEDNNFIKYFARKY